MSLDTKSWIFHYHANFTCQVINQFAAFLIIENIHSISISCILLFYSNSFQLVVHVSRCIIFAHLSFIRLIVIVPFFKVSMCFVLNNISLLVTDQGSTYIFCQIKEAATAVKTLINNLSRFKVTLEIHFNRDRNI